MFGGASTAGNTDKLGNITFTLNSIETLSVQSGTIVVTVVVFNSTASEKIMKATTITCSDGAKAQHVYITTKSKLVTQHCNLKINIII